MVDLDVIGESVPILLKGVLDHPFWCRGSLVVAVQGALWCFEVETPGVFKVDRFSQGHVDMHVGSPVFVFFESHNVSLDSGLLEVLLQSEPTRRYV